MKTHNKLIIALILGAILGIILHDYRSYEWIQIANTHFLNPIGQIFLRLIFMLVIPMVFAALVMGVYELAYSQGVGRIAGRTLGYTILTSSISVLIGVFMVNALQPGRGMDTSMLSSLSKTTDVDKIKANVAAAKPVSQIIVELIPKNPLDAAVRAFDGEMVALMFFALMFGFALSKTVIHDHGKNVIIQILDQVFNTCITLMNYVMLLAPYAVFALVFNSTFLLGYEILLRLLFYVGVVIVALLIQNFGVYSILLKYVAKRSPKEFFSNCKEVLLYAFATASSNATLPRSLETAEKKLKLQPEISRFVLTVGSTANQNGTALFEGITVLFLAQVYGIDLSLTQQFQVVIMSIIAGIGTAGVPGGSLPLILILLQQIGVPAEGLGMVLGVDRLLDMCRTTVNVSGDLVIAALVNGTPVEPATAPELRAAFKG